MLCVLTMTVASYVPAFHVKRIELAEAGSSCLWKARRQLLSEATFPPLILLEKRTESHLPRLVWESSDYEALASRVGFSR